MSKRSRNESHGDERESLGEEHSVSPSSRRRPPRRRQRQQQQQQHLYLVLDDWERGYSVYRVDEDDFDSDDDTLDDADARPADSPLVRLEAPHGFSWSLVAHGTKIMAMCPSESSPGIPAFDTKTLAVTVCPSPPSRGFERFRPLYASVGGKLLAFVNTIVDVLGAEPPPTEDSWSWTGVEATPPFDSNHVLCYAAHPDGRTVFVSVQQWCPAVDDSVSCSFPGRSRERNSTFTFDMVRLYWAHAGEWLLPFKGRADYDRELDAWVGLCRHEEGAGRVCCCAVPPAAGCETMPAWKLGRDVFFDFEKPSEPHLGATLVYRGESGFFLVEKQARISSTEPRAQIRVLKITSFVLKYDKDGELRTTLHRAYASVGYRLKYYHLVDRMRDPLAFWM